MHYICIKLVMLLTKQLNNKTMYNSKEFIKANLFISQDSKTAYIHSHDVVDHISDLSERDEAFNEAVEVIEKIGWKATDCELETIGWGCTQNFERC